MNGSQRIAAERHRQITNKRWTAKHDDEHVDGELAAAAACYATPDLLYRKKEHANQIEFIDPWPWEQRWDKRPRRSEGSNCVAPNDQFYVSMDERIRQLEKAGALVAAEIDRLLRIKSKRERNVNP